MKPAEQFFQVGDTRAELKNELALVNMTLNPIPPHVHGFGMFLFEGSVVKYL